MSIFDAIVLGLVEGITEYLPVSSTGHLILASWLLGLDDSPVQRAAIHQFEIIIQGGAILAVIGLYRRPIAVMLRGLASLAYPAWRGPRARNGRLLLRNLILSCLPAAILGLLLRAWIKERFFAPAPVLLALGLGGALMVALAPWHKDRLKRMGGDSAEAMAQLSMSAALAIGLLQCLALWPGTSRSLVTILGGMMVGLSPRRAAEYSFLLALPVLGGACLVEGREALSDPEGFFTAIGGVAPALTGLLVATVSAAFAIRWLVEWLSRSTLGVFGWWRIGLAGALGLAAAMGWLNISGG